MMKEKMVLKRRGLESVLLLAVGLLGYGVLWTDNVPVHLNPEDGAASLLGGGACCSLAIPQSCAWVGDNPGDCQGDIEVCVNDPAGTKTCKMGNIEYCTESPCVSTAYSDSCS